MQAREQREMQLIEMLKAKTTEADVKEEFLLHSSLFFENPPLKKVSPLLIF